MPLLGGNASPSEFFRPGGNASVATPQKLQKGQTLPQTSEKASRDQDLEETRSIGGASSYHADEPEELSKDEVQMIKARTMFQMVEDIQSSGGSAKKLLFLTNSQAEYLSSSQQTLVKMLDALELPKPKLVINILTPISREIGRSLVKNKKLASSTTDLHSYRWKRSGPPKGRSSDSWPMCCCLSLLKPMPSCFAVRTLQAVSSARR